MKLEQKQKAIYFRKQGLSINEIVQKVKVSKGSVSLWVRDVVLTKEQKNRLSKNGRSVHSIEERRKSRLYNQKKKDDIITLQAKNEINSISKNDLKLIGICLYLGEGGKTKKGMARIANSDPDVIKIMMRFFREVCLVPEEKFRGHVHVFEHSNISKTEKYWSEISGIKVEQFFKTYTKKSSASLEKRHTLPFGTFDIYVCDTKLFLTIMGWIEKVKELTI